MENINEIFSDLSLKLAWANVKEKKSAGGIDEVTLRDFESDLTKNFLEIISEVQNDIYIPEPYKRIYIQKEDKNEYRPIGLLTIKDKIIQHCVKLFYEESIDKKFVNNSYAYRPSKGHFKAIRRVMDYIARKYCYFAHLDVDCFFDTIDHEILFAELPYYFKNEIVLKLIQMWVKTGVVFHQRYIDSKRGVAQGGVVSPILSNIYLHSFDLQLQNKKIEFVRYADNILMAAKNRADIEMCVAFAKDKIKDLKLEFNKVEYEIFNIQKGLSFCGIFFVNDKRFISSKKFDSIKDKVRFIIKKNTLEMIPAELNSYLEGIKRYYFPFEVKEQIGLLNEYILNKISEKWQEKGKSNIKEKEIKSFLLNIAFLQYPESQLNLSIIAKNIVNNNSNLLIKSDKIEKQVTSAIQKKKKTYQKIYYRNIDFAVITPFSALGISGNKITLRKDNKVLNSVSADNIKNIMILCNSVSVSGKVIEFCANRFIELDYYDEIGNPIASLVSALRPSLTHTYMQELNRENDVGKSILKEIIIAKIKNQVNLIKYLTKNYLTKDKIEFNLACDNMLNSVESIEALSFLLPAAEFRSKVFGYEGIAASLYWALIGKIIPEKYNFINREHQNASNIINIMLNYAYGVLSTRVKNAIYSNKLNPSIGFLHQVQDGKPVLIYDFIEPFRAPVADRAVMGLASKSNNLKIEKKILSVDTKKILLEKVLFRINCDFTYKNKQVSYSDILNEQCQEIVSVLYKKQKKLKAYLFKY